MALTQSEKESLKQERDRMCASARKFANESVEDLYVIDHMPMIEGAQVPAELLGKLPRACWTRGKQGHG